VPLGALALGKSCDMMASIWEGHSVPVVARINTCESAHCAAGGFFTGWRGVLVGLAALAVAVILGFTGTFASQNTVVKLAKADVRNINRNSSAQPL
jgi:hypothetical protein